MVMRNQTVKFSKTGASWKCWLLFSWLIVQLRTDENNNYNNNNNLKGNTNIMVEVLRK